MFNAKQKKFPSSIGELHFSMEPQGLLAQLVEQFPSPIGELHFSIMCCDYSINYQTRFRPLSGNYISQLNRATLTGFVTEFPSPVGELHFSMVARNSPSPNIQFPSPVGELHFSIWKWNHLYFCAGVSVPCRGTTFLNDTVWNLILKVSKCFRPLSGNYISQ